MDVFDLVFSSTCLIITAQLSDGALGLFLSGNDPGTNTAVSYTHLTLPTKA